MKTKKKILVVALILTMICGAVTGCGNKQEVVDNTKKDGQNLKIMLYAKGYGTDWLTAMEKAYEEKNPGVAVEVTLVNSAEVIRSDIKNSEYCDTDLYFDIVENSGQYMVEEYKYAYENSQAMLDLTELYNTTIPGEEVTLGEKMNESIKYASITGGRETEDASDDTFLFVPYVTGAMGLYYNETVINNALGEGNWEVPNTTDELYALCEQLKAKGCELLLPGSLDAWTSSLYLSWWSQYEGITNYRKFYDGIGFEKNSGLEAENSAAIFDQPGRLEALKVSESFIGYGKGFAPKNAVEINVNNLNEYQTRFTLQKNNYAFYPMGDWLMQELENNTTVPSDSVIKMMKTPVISSIINSTDSYSRDNTKRLPNITSDEMLSQVIDYVEGNGELPAGVTEEEVAFVKDARNTVGGKALEHIAYIPTYSNATDLAKDFLLFMASDEGIQIFKDNCIGGFAPYEYEYDKESLTVTELSVYETTANANFVDDYYHNILFYRAGVRGTSVGTSDTIESLLCKPDGKNAEEIFQMMKDAFTGTKWSTFLTLINQ